VHLFGIVDANKFLYHLDVMILKLIKLPLSKKYFFPKKLVKN